MNNNRQLKFIRDYSADSDDSPLGHFQKHVTKSEQVPFNLTQGISS